MPKYVVFLVVIATLFLCIRYLFFTFAQQPLPTDTLISVVGTVSTSPKIKQNTQSFFLRVQQYREVYVTLSSYPRYHYGERLVVKGKVKKTTFEDGSVFFSLGYPLVESAQTQNYFFLVRKAILSKFERVIPPDDARLLLGIVL